MTATLVTSVGPARRCHVTEGAATSASFTTRRGPASRYVTSGLSRHVPPSLTHTHRPDLWPDAGPLAPSRLAASVVSMATSSVRSTVHSMRAHSYAHVRTDVHRSTHTRTHVYLHTYTHTRQLVHSRHLLVLWLYLSACLPHSPSELSLDGQTNNETERQTGRRTDRLC